MYIIKDTELKFNTWSEAVKFLIKHPEIGGDRLKYVKEN